MTKHIIKPLSVLLASCLLSSAMTVGAGAAGCAFPDAEGHWAQSIIDELTDEGIVRGYPDGYVYPDGSITSAEFSALLSRAMGLTGVASSEDECWAVDSISALAEAGIIEEESFLPNAPISRMAMIKMLVRALEISCADDEAFIEKASELGLLLGYPDGSICPDNTATRAEAFAMLLRQRTVVIPEPEPTPSPTPTPSTGGYYVPPAPEFWFELRETAYVGETISVKPAAKNVRKTTWALLRDGETVELPENFDTTGGSLTFDKAGEYTLTATADNGYGKTATFEKKVTVFPVIEAALTLPETSHTDEAIVVKLNTSNLGTNEVVWSLKKDGEPAELEEELGFAGGVLHLSEAGSYELTATITDALGITSVASDTVQVLSVAAPKLIAPAAIHTDTTASISLTGDLLSMMPVWTLTRNGESVELSDYIDGSIGSGNVRFTEKGVYVVTTTLTDETGRDFFAEAKVTVYPVGSAGFYLPEIFHTDDMVNVEATFGEIGSKAAEWILTRNGVPTEIKAVLSNAGGKLRVSETGDYVLTASFTDDGGREYSYEQSFKVYPVPKVSFALKNNAHTDSNIQLSVESKDTDDLSIEWLVDNSFGFQDWDTFVDGELSNTGGSIRFKRAGTYEIVARITDATGRVFLYENGGKCEVLPVLDLRFTMPANTYTDEIVSIRTSGNNNALPVEWSLTKSDEPVDISTAIDGSLNALGGNIRFKEYGDYTITASMTDALGRSFSHSESISVLPIVTYGFSMPQSIHYGTAFTVEAFSENLGTSTVDWELTRNGESIEYTGTLASDGGNIAISQLGTFELAARVTDANGRVFSDSHSIEITNTAPTVSISATPTRTTKDGKFYVTTSASANDADGDATEIEYDGFSSDGYYAVGTHTIRARAKDACGTYGEWSTKTFEVVNSAPTTPVIARTPAGNL